MDRNSIREFQNTVHNCDMMDLAQVGPSFTWSNCQDANLISKNLDRVMVNTCWINEFPNSFATFESGGVSDHMRLHIQLRAATPRNSKPFKFFNHTATHPRYLEVVANMWNESDLMFHSRSALKMFQEKDKALMLDYFSTDFLIQSQGGLSQGTCKVRGGGELEIRIKPDPDNGTICRSRKPN
ncbi:hypothetical protein F2Q70_00018188 [Brassica cretica]|uniref:Endonuclease/exonuclease/phosphatase domain-containing protein n=1 Tax=Brassica cretica TaxID=69181 RepID=A0A8S9I4P9_BRACR|nr:hypothetical protein F2Q70_00018188 [Brassica cretica]